jgi:hypothetical protein
MVRSPSLVPPGKLGSAWADGSDVARRFEVVYSHRSCSRKDYMQPALVGTVVELADRLVPGLENGQGLYAAL